MIGLCSKTTIAYAAPRVALIKHSPIINSTDICFFSQETLVTQFSYCTGHCDRVHKPAALLAHLTCFARQRMRCTFLSVHIDESPQSAE